MKTLLGRTERDVANFEVLAMSVSVLLYRLGMEQGVWISREEIEASEAIRGPLYLHTEMDEQGVTLSAHPKDRHPKPV